MVELKTSAHNSILLQPFYSMINNEAYELLQEFYWRSSYIGQIFNDAKDLIEDKKIGQISYFKYKDKNCSILTTSEGRELSLMLRELVKFIEKCPKQLQVPCYGKFSTFIHQSAQIGVQ